MKRRVTVLLRRRTSSKRVQLPRPSGAIVLAARGEDDDAALVVKRLVSTARKQTLVSDNRAHAPIALDDTWAIVAILLEVLASPA